MFLILRLLIQGVDRDSAVGIATIYGLDVLGIEHRWGVRILYSFILALWPTQPPIQWVMGHFLGLSGSGVAFTTHTI